MQVLVLFILKMYGVMVLQKKEWTSSLDAYINFENGAKGIFYASKIHIFKC